MRYVVTYSPREGVRREHEPSFATKREANKKIKYLRILYGSGSNPRIKKRNKLKMDVK